MKKILLSQARKQLIKKDQFYAIVDDSDYEYLIQWNWQAFKAKHTCYATRRIKLSGDKSTIIYMHRQILGLPNSKILCDHVDHNGLNNQKINLRSCNHQQNGMNKRPKRNGTSKYLGVTLYTDKRRGYKYWIVRLHEKGKCLFSSQFPFTEEGEILAAKAYDIKAKEFWGEFANLNFKE